MSLTLILLVNVLITATKSAKILGLFLTASYSHQVIYQPVWKELSLRGHEVTVITTDPLEDPSLVNLTEISVRKAYGDMIASNMVEVMGKDRFLFERYMNAYDVYNDLYSNILRYPEVEQIIKDNTTRYDLILMEAMHPLVYGFVAKYKVPFVEIFSVCGTLKMHDAVYNPTHPVLNPDLWSSLNGDTLYERVKSTFAEVIARILYRFYHLPKTDRTARKFFGNDIPYIGDIEKNVSIMLLNVNPVLFSVRPNVPSIVEIQQMHIRPKRPLPTDLQKILDEAKQGVIYLSLGSNVKSANLSTELRKTITSALSELPYLVLWKWETDYLPNKPKNVITRQWLPQQDVLGHPNIKVFLTQGGIQSLEEAISNAVPLVAMPFFADQPINVKKMVDLGIAVSVDYTTVTKEQLKNAIVQVATNKKYKEKVKQLSVLIKDQPMTGLQKAVWWIEFVLRHNGATHLKSPALNIPLYQYYLLDVIAIVLCVLLISIYLLNKVTKHVLRVFSANYTSQKCKVS